MDPKFTDLPVAALTTDAQGGILAFNRAAETLFGYAASDVVGRNIEMLLPESYRQEHTARMRAHIPAHGVCRECVGTGRRKDGTPLALQIRMRVSPAGETPAFVAVVTEDAATRRLQAENRLLIEAGLGMDETQTLTDALSLVLRRVCEVTGWTMGEAWVPAASGDCLELSPAWHSGVSDLARFHEESRAWRFPPGRGLPGTTWSTRKPAWIPDVRTTATFSRAVLAGTFGLATAFGVPVFSGEQVVAILVFYSTDRREEDGRLLDTVAAVATHLGSVLARRKAQEELRVAEERLRQSQKLEAIGRLAAGVAHDFNNMLTAISGFASLIQTRPGNEPADREHAAEILGAADRAAGLTRQLLAFSRKQILQPVVLDVNARIAQMRAMLKRIVGEDIELILHLGASAPRVLVDPTQLEQVVLNLAVNAKDAMPDGGPLLIETHCALLGPCAVGGRALPAGPHLLIAVTDRGRGMDDETRAQIFEPFFTTKPATRGTGLGLSTVYGIVTQSGGRINVYSEPGYGTSFKIYLPQAQGEAEAPAPAADPVAGLGRAEHILVVEDDASVCEFIAQALEQAGYSVLAANSPGAALALLDKTPGRVDLLLTDIVLPGMNGRALSEQVVARFPSAKVLYISGYTDNVICDRGILNREFRILQKPFAIEALLPAVRSALDS